ncbi:MAG TPA: hypothetical protein VEW95_09490 [Candidatus Limnocylindrales bacterium]|nr:hypothetical protein [Candidatus Limnocylindrales bacterium]
MGRNDTTTQKDEGGWVSLSLQEFREAGLLQRVNREFFWPLGLALTITARNLEEPVEGGVPGVDWKVDWSNAHLTVMATEPPDSIESSPDQRDLSAEASAWIANRQKELRS